MDSAAGLGQVRKHVAWENVTLALFSFSAAVVVFLASYLEYGAGGVSPGLFAESQTVVMILFFLVLIQSLYYALVVRNSTRTPAEASLYSVLDSESTYFIAFAATASTVVYGVSELGHLPSNNSISALTAASILAVLLVVQLAYSVIGARLGKGK